MSMIIRTIFMCHKILIDNYNHFSKLNENLLYDRMKQNKLLQEIIMKIQESGENYLETILILQKKMGSVRSIDIANELDYTKASISRAMSILKKAEYINMEQNGEITLTEKGMKKASEIYERHTLITKYLMDTLSIDEEIADRDACRIEHILSSEAFEKIKELYKK